MSICPLKKHQNLLFPEKAEPVLEIPIELWHPKHGLGEHSEKPNSLNKGAEVDQEEHEDGGEDCDEHDELDIAWEVGPGPEELRIKIGENSGLPLLNKQVFLYIRKVNKYSSTKGESQHQVYVKNEVFRR